MQSVQERETAQSALLREETTPPASEPLRWARVAADTLTVSRLVAGITLALWPWEASVRSLAALFRWKILLWSLDAVDGVLARRSRTPPSWIGRNDIWVDSLVTLGTGTALARMGYLSGNLLALWLAVCTALYVIRPVHTVLLVFMFPLHLALVGLATIHRLHEVGLFLLWLLALAYLARKRLKWVIGVFIEGLPDGPREWVLSWLPAWLRLSPEERAAFQIDPVETGTASEDKRLTRDRCDER